MMLAFDRDTARSYDQEGRLHVAVTNVSKAAINPYLGREIPDADALGLDPAKTYRLFRDPEELKKAAPTFNNLPVLSRHVPVTADDHQPDLVVGSTGTDAEFEHPYLRNSLVIWARDAIDGVESAAKKELSSAYRYRADMTPGTFEGEAYDGVMRDIVGNHVALVKEGRAGPDVVVGDSNEEINQMATKALTSRKALLAQGALVAYLKPRLAQDAKFDITPLLADVTAKNFKEKKAAIMADLKAGTAGKLAKDASVDDVAELLDALEAEGIGEGADNLEPNAATPPVKPDDSAMDAEGAAKIKADILAFLKGKVGDADLAKIGEMFGADEETDEDKQKREEEAKRAKEGPEVKDMVTKSAMDEAIARVRKDAAAEGAAAAIKEQREIREAERVVRPYVGELAIAQDSAEAVYRTALNALGVKTDGIHASAFRALLQAQPLPGTKKPAAVAMDSASAKGFAERFPSAQRINVV